MNLILNEEFGLQVSFSGTSIKCVFNSGIVATKFYVLVVLAHSASLFALQMIETTDRQI